MQASVYSSFLDVISRRVAPALSSATICCSGQLKCVNHPLRDTSPTRQAFQASPTARTNFPCNRCECRLRPRRPLRGPTSPNGASQRGKGTRNYRLALTCPSTRAAGGSRTDPHRLDCEAPVHSRTKDQGGVKTPNASTRRVARAAFGSPAERVHHTSSSYPLGESKAAIPGGVNEPRLRIAPSRKCRSGARWNEKRTNEHNYTSEG